MGSTAHLVRAQCLFTAQGDRPAQEDHVLANRDKGIWIVADGFGGAQAGAEVSRAACEAVKGFLEREAGDLEATLPFVLRSYFSLAGNVLFNALIHANRKAVTLNRGKNVNEKGGASILAGYLDGDLLALANVGACTAWLFREGRGTELVQPRTYGRLCDPFSEQINPVHQVPLAAVGMAEDLEPEIIECRIRPGDWLLLQTDGLEKDGRDSLAQLQLKGLSPEAALEEATQLLKGLSYTDNLAATLVIL